jgi:RNA polymerase sigma-70 factor (ECF subfamily)
MDDESQLIRAAQAGSEEAFDALVVRYHLLVLWTAQALLADSTSAEDVAQEAWISAWRALNRFDQTRPFRPWLLRIVTNCCRMQARSAAHDVARESADGALPGEDDLLTHVIRREEIAALDAVITSLPPIQRQVIQLRYLAELDLAEIAIVMELPLGTVKSRLHRALIAIRQQMKMLATPEDVR